MGIQGRLNLAVGLSALAGLVLFTFYNFYREQEIYEREVIVRKGIAVGKALSVPCLQYLVDERQEQIDDYLAKFQGTELDLLYISVHDRQGQVVSHSDAWQFAWQHFHPRDRFTQAALEAQEPFVQRFYDEALGQLVADVALPLRKGGVRWGTIRLGLSFERAERSALGATLVGVLASLIMVAALLIFLRWWVSRDLIDPILRLSDALSRLRGGELVKVNVKEGGELGTLLQNFNQAISVLHESQDMREKLERIEKITRSHERLEQAHVELTKAHLGLEAAHAELRNAKDQLVRSEKLVGLGRLTAGLAHEINNPVNYISNSILPLQEALQRVLDHFAERDDVDEEIAEDLQDMQTSLSLISKGISRTSRIISDLRDFSYMGPAKIENFDVHEEIEKALTLLGAKLRNVELEKKFCSVTRIEGYPGLMGQVILNLLHNAVQAMDGRGKIAITTRVVDSGLAIAIEDTGEGIPPENLGRIFDPFFTSKEVGKGTGLGLWVSHEFIERHHGSIGVESKIGKGTTFTVVLPLEQPREPVETAP